MPTALALVRRSKPADLARLSIQIRETAYLVRMMPVDPAAGVSKLVRLKKADGTTYYVAHQGTWITCDCGDAEFRHNNTNGTLCKHARGLIACGLLASPTQPQAPVVATQREMATPAPARTPALVGPVTSLRRRSFGEGL